MKRIYIDSFISTTRKILLSFRADSGARYFMDGTYLSFNLFLSNPNFFPEYEVIFWANKNRRDIKDIRNFFFFKCLANPHL